jgi:tetratricopeptide (TPR) repeat protein
VGRSDEWLRQIETGGRRLDSIECTVRLAEILRVDVATLLGLSTKQLPRNSDSGEELVRPIRRALMDSPTASAFLEKASDSPPDHATQDQDFDTAIDQAWTTWLQCSERYASTVEKLPALLYRAGVRSSQAISGKSGASKPGATESLAESTKGNSWAKPIISTYQLARVVLEKLGEHHLAWLAADRAMRIAEITGHPRIQAAAGWHLAQCYLQTGRYLEASSFALAIARKLAPQRPLEAEAAALWGALHLVAAQAKASQAELHQAEELLATATAAASLFPGERRVFTVPFGSVEVGIASVQIASRLGRLGEALKLAATVDVPDDYPADTQVRHYLPLAYVHSRRNEDAAAVLALLKTAGLSREDLCYDEMAHQTLARLLSRNNLTVRRELKQLAEIAEAGGLPHFPLSSPTTAFLAKNSLAGISFSAAASA